MYGHWIIRFIISGHYHPVHSLLLYTMMPSYAWPLDHWLCPSILRSKHYRPTSTIVYDNVLDIAIGSSDQYQLPKVDCCIFLIVQ